MWKTRIKLKSHAERDIHIDVAKGIGIFTVVYGHILSGGIAKEFIFLFHMPFFFLISGYLHKKTPNQLTFLKRKSLSLLLPYAAYLLIFKGFFITESLFDFVLNPEKLSLYRFLVGVGRLVYGGMYLGGVIGVFWFVTCLFLTQQLFNTVVVRIQSGKKIFFLSLLLYILAMADQYAPVNIIFPWNINVVLCSFLFYTLGYFWGNQILKKHSIWQLFTAILVAFISLILIVFKYPIAFKMKWSYYGWIVFSPLAALAIIKIVGFCADIISRQKTLAALAVFAGKASMTIMFTHLFFYRVVFKTSDRYPWILSFVVLLTCCLLHYLFSKNNILKAILLGDREAYSQLAKK